MRNIRYTLIMTAGLLAGCATLNLSTSAEYGTDIVVVLAATRAENQKPVNWSDRDCHGLLRHRGEKTRYTFREGHSAALRIPGRIADSAEVGVECRGQWTLISRLDFARKPGVYVLPAATMVFASPAASKPSDVKFALHDQTLWPFLTAYPKFDSSKVRGQFRKVKPVR